MMARVTSRPSHFLSIPLGQVHVDLRTKVAAFAEAMDIDYRSIVVAPARVHFTLGVMTLSSKTGYKSVEEALTLLRTLPTLLPLPSIEGTCPMVSLDHVDVLKRDGRRAAHILHIGPNPNGNERLYDICSRVQAIFQEAGFIQETRPLKLHMTLMNTSFLRSKSRKAEPFPIDVLRGASGRALGLPEDLPLDFDLPADIAWGAYEANSIHLCSMGSRGPDGAYVSLGSVPLSNQT